jgi:Uma2 family endonuclease
MANTVTARRPATYEDLLTVPDHLVAEILDGDLVTSPRPASPHALTAGRVFRDLSGSFDGPAGGDGRGGWWILFEPELHFGKDVVVPDLGAWRHSRMPTFLSVSFFELVPDWACEVASPSTVRIDRVRKMNVYAHAGVNHLWLVDALARTLEVYRLENGRWIVAGTYGGDTKVRVEPFEALEVDLARWWPPIPEAR